MAVGKGTCVIGVIDDHEDSRLVLRAILEPEFRLQEFDRGLDALRALPARPPCMIVLDIAMPGLNGFETLAMVKRDAALRRVPVLAYTAFINPEERRRYMWAGFSGLICKPIIDIDAVLQLIRRTADCPPSRGRSQPAVGVDQPFRRGGPAVSRHAAEASR